MGGPFDPHPPTLDVRGLIFKVLNKCLYGLDGGGIESSRKDTGAKTFKLVKIMYNT